VPSVCLDSKVAVGTIIKGTSSFTGDVCNGNRRPINSRHTEDCHLHLNIYVRHVTRDGYDAFPTTVPAVLADTLLHCLLLHIGSDLVPIQQYVSESVQSCDDPEQLLQGKKQQQFYVRELS